MRGELSHDACGTDVPEEDGFIVGACDEHVAFGTECEAVDVVAVARHRGGWDREVAGQWIPEEYAFVVGGGGEGVWRAYLRPGNGIYAGFVGTERAQEFEGGVLGWLVGYDVDVYAGVCGGRGEEGHVGGEFGACYAAGVGVGEGE